MKLERNDRCPCGSGKKYKKCCYLVPIKNVEVIRATQSANSWDELVEQLSKPMEIFRLKVILTRMGFDEFDEEISRVLEVVGNQTLYDLHMNIQTVFKWDNDHMFSFYFGGKLFDRDNEYSANPFGDHIASTLGLGPSSKSASATEIRDLDLAEDSTFLYLFDYGDELVHKIIVEKVRDKNDEDKQFPILINETGTPPSQYGDFE